MRTKTQFIVTPKTAREQEIVDKYGSAWTFVIVYTPIWARDRYLVPTVPALHPDKLIYWRRSQIQLHS